MMLWKVLHSICNIHSICNMPAPGRLHRYGPRGTCEIEQPLPVSADYASIQKLSVLSGQSALTCA